MNTTLYRCFLLVLTIVPVAAVVAGYLLLMPPRAETAQMQHLGRADAVAPVPPSIPDTHSTLTGAVKFLGHKEGKGCAKCHEPQFESWAKTKHANAIESLEPGKATGAKRDAGLDPQKDYTEDPDCLKCHVTGLDEGGYKVGSRRAAGKFYGIGCESCHGAGGDYQPIKDSYEDDNFPREEIIAAGMLYGELETCTVCHNTDEDNPFPEPDFETESYDDGILDAHDHIKQKVHPPREGSEWLYDE